MYLKSDSVLALRLLKPLIVAWRAQKVRHDYSDVVFRETASDAAHRSVVPHPEIKGIAVVDVDFVM
jgi:hypothetical protein